MDFQKSKKLKTSICFQTLHKIIVEISFTYIKATVYVILYFYIRARNVKDHVIVYGLSLTGIYFTEFIMRIRTIHEYECSLW